jgi:hypothetical protein
VQQVQQAVLTKDQWWFVLVTAGVQAVVTVVAVALGARWALAKDHEVRRRGRSEELAVSAVGTLDLIDRKLQHVRWNALPIPDVSERQQRLSRHGNRHRKPSFSPTT